jgi:hypothetical protein
MKTFEAVRFAVAAAMVPVMLVQQGFAWGAGGHTLINGLACAALPADVPEFLRSPAARSAMEHYGPEPDHWKETAEPELKAAGEPEHFMDMEWADLTVSPLPRKRYDFIRALAYAQKAHPDATLTPEGTGLLPYAIDEGYERLKAAMRGYRIISKNHEDTKPIEAEIVFLAGILGHWVADGSQPLHTTTQYNGWTLPNPNGYTTDHKIHSQFEMAFVRSAVTDPVKDVAPLIPAKARVIDDVFEDEVKYLRHSNSMVEQVYKFEKAGSLNGTGTAESRAFVDERLAAGATELRDIIYTAWVKSGDPLPPYRGQP